PGPQTVAARRRLGRAPRPPGLPSAAGGIGGRSEGARPLSASQRGVPRTKRLVGRCFAENGRSAKNRYAITSHWTVLLAPPTMRVSARCRWLAASSLLLGPELMAAETLSCPYCNATITLLRPAGSGQRLRCPRCHELMPSRAGGPVNEE